MFMDRRIKVLHVVPDLAYGGVEKMILNYYGEIDRSRYIFDYVTHGAESPYHQKLLDDGSRIYYCKTIGALGYFGYKRQVKEKICFKEYDIIHVHIGHGVGLYAKIFGDIGAKCIVCHAHTTRCVNPKHRCLMPLFRRWTARYGNRLLACGEEAGRFCFGGKPFEVIPNGIDFDLYKNVSSDNMADLKKEFGIPEDAFVVGHVGHFSAPKNHPFVVELIAAYSKIYPDVYFVLIGDGPTKEAIMRSVPQTTMAQGKVIFPGVRNDIPVWMRMFDAFILPSLHEGLPVVAIEAQAAGTPCLISSTVDCSLDTGLGLVGFLPIDKGSDCWIDALESIRRSRGRRKDTDTIHRALIESGYDVKVSAKRLTVVYDSLMRKDQDANLHKKYG